MLLRVVEGNRLFLVSTGSSEISQKIDSVSQRMMGSQEEGWVLNALGQAQALLPEFARHPDFPSGRMKQPQSEQHGKELRRLANLLTQFSRTGIYFSYLRCGKSFHSHE